ncbi:MAG: sulfite exporter TauE/SafE family protein [Elusimicrobiota bacterium]|jgi:uncharacterized membrane protein YfcA|nr:sulfite exporter TauE/SafE family protein [Elusimicrobiota bacterium]
MELSNHALFMLALLALATGINKTGFPGLGVLVVVLLTTVMPAKVSTGYLLPLLCFGDIVAILYWRNNALWNVIIRLSPWVIAGIVIGFFLMKSIPDESYGIIFGSIVTALFSLDIIRRYLHIDIPDDKSIIVGGFGLLAGLMTMMINAAGPVMIIYLLSMKISKQKFVATCAWSYFIFNLVKIPFSYAQGLITPQSLLLNLKFAPLVVVGGVIGIIFMNKIPTKTFNIIIWIFALLGGIKLFF